MSRPKRPKPVAKLEPAGPRLAGKCAFLRSTLSREVQGDLVNLCMHIVREARQCVGPFLDDAQTTCGLWEERKEGQPLPPLPKDF